ncbi:hypothetical protein Tco_0196593 [Tanacetum coccineum]
MRASHQLCSSVPSIPHSSTAITERPSHSSSAARADLLPSQKRIRSSDSATDLEDCSDILRGFHDETYSEPDIDLEIQAEIDRVMHPAGHEIVATGQQSTVMSERINELERDNTRLIGTIMSNTRFGATMTREAVDELIARRVAEALETHE